MKSRFDVYKTSNKEVLIIVDRNDTMEFQIPCTDLEALDLMWKIHAEMGGGGTLTRD